MQSQFPRHIPCAPRKEKKESKLNEELFFLSQALFLASLESKCYFVLWPETHVAANHGFFGKLLLPMKLTPNSF